MKTRLLSTVAATLLIGTGIAYAQSPGSQSAPERAPAAQQKAPAEKVAPPMNAGQHKAPETSGQASPDSKMDRGSSGTMNRSSDTNKAPETAAPKAGDHDKSGAGMKSSSERDSKSDMNKSATDSTKSPNQNNAQGAKSGQSTTGQGAAAGQAKLSTEQRTKITTAFKSDKSLKSVSKSEINVNISVGTKIPTHVHVYPVPQEVVTVYPQWRGYDVILVDGEYLIIEPRTREIVFIIEA